MSMCMLSLTINVEISANNDKSDSSKILEIQKQIKLK